MNEAPSTKSPYVRVGVYIFFYAVTVIFSTSPLTGLGGDFLGITLSAFLAAWLANFLALRIYEHHSLATIGLGMQAPALRHFALGVAGGFGAAVLVVAIGFASGMARAEPAAGHDVTPGSFAFVTILLLAGATGEELFFRGYGFQVLVRTWGPFATILPAGVVFGLLHASNPNATYLGIANTVGFGILFGYAFLRSGDLWFPIGLHFGWNFALPLFGLNVSGFTMRLTGYAVRWSAGEIWSGGAYGPEGSLLTTFALSALLLYLRRAPLQQQPLAPLDEAVKGD
ncbi:MAG: lysostaphin resistance A-like protein [Bryobacteraceae bacterium]